MNTMSIVFYFLCSSLNSFRSAQDVSKTLKSLSPVTSVSKVSCDVAPGAAAAVGGPHGLPEACQGDPGEEAIGQRSRNRLEFGVKMMKNIGKMSYNLIEIMSYMSYFCVFFD